LRRRILAIAEKILRHSDAFSQHEKVVPGFRPPGQNDVPGNLITADENLRTFKPQVSGQADGLAAPVAKEFGDSMHGIYRNIYHASCQAACLGLAESPPGASAPVLRPPWFFLACDLNVQRQQFIATMPDLL
jgi:hypothetical protein